MNSPSGDQAGSRSNPSPLLVSRRRPDSSPRIVQRSPLRSWKTIQPGSGPPLGSGVVRMGGIGADVATVVGRPSTSPEQAETTIADRTKGRIAHRTGLEHLTGGQPPLSTFAAQMSKCVRWDDVRERDPTTVPPQHA
jgi:hypothetical protein